MLLALSTCAIAPSVGWKAKNCCHVRSGQPLEDGGDGQVWKPVQGEQVGASFSAAASYTAAAAFSQPGETKGSPSSVEPPLKPEDAMFVWHLSTAETSFERFADMPSEHLSPFASGGICPASSPDGSMADVAKFQ